MADLIERLRALDTAATPAPWYRLDPPWLPSGSETSILAGSPDPHVATFICDFDFFAFDEEDEKTSECPDADADLIVFLRNNITELADEITALRARVAELEAKSYVEFTDGMEAAAEILRFTGHLRRCRQLRGRNRLRGCNHEGRS